MKKYSIKRTIILFVAALCLSGCSPKVNNMDEGIKALEESRYEEAIDFFSKEIANQKNLMEAYRGEGIAYLRMGKYQSAVLAFKEALGNSKGTIGDFEKDICYYLAESLYCAGEYEEAITNCTNLIDYDNENPKTYFFRGSIYMAMGNEEDALKDFDNALLYEEEKLECYINIYEVLKAGGSSKSDSYLDEAEKLLETEKNDTAAYYCNAGRVKYYKGNVDEAIELLGKAKQLDEKNANVYSMLGYCYMSEGNYAMALDELKLGVGNAHGDSWRHIKKSIIICQENLGDFASAKTEMEEYLERYPEDEDALREYDFLKSR